MEKLIEAKAMKRLKSLMAIQANSKAQSEDCQVLKFAVLLVSLERILKAVPFYDHRPSE